MVNLASRWSAADYARQGAFVPRLGEAALRLLDPQPDELILDLGCGDGALTERIVEAGARVVGLDSSADMVEAARARGIDAYVADGEALDVASLLARFGRFDAIFSNAALHWMLDARGVADALSALLRDGGRFAGEMGGAGNLARLRRALREELTERGYLMPAEDPQWYAEVAEFAAVYAAAGFTAIDARLIDRPTDLPAGVAGWVTTFRAGVMDMTGVPEGERADVAAAVERRLAPALRRPDGSWFADYVRLRFAMRKPG